MKIITSGSSPAQAELYETWDGPFKTLSWFVVFIDSFTPTCYLLTLASKQKRRDVKWCHYSAGAEAELWMNESLSWSGSAWIFLNFAHAGWLTRWLKWLENVILFGEWIYLLLIFVLLKGCFSQWVKISIAESCTHLLFSFYFILFFSL